MVRSERSPAWNSPPDRSMRLLTCRPSADSFFITPTANAQESSRRRSRRTSSRSSPIAGCNSGPCHGKSRLRQNGFQLSLLGYDPQFGCEALTQEARGRRVFPAAAGRRASSSPSRPGSFRTAAARRSRSAIAATTRSFAGSGPARRGLRPTSRRSNESPSPQAND